MDCEHKYSEDGIKMMLAFPNDKINVVFERTSAPLFADLFVYAHEAEFITTFM